MNPPNKIFGIGLSKTGTTSLAAALRILNFPTKHLPLVESDFQRYQAFCDSSVAVAFQSLDARFPGAKFIYTVREHSSWLSSCRQHFFKPAKRPKLRKIRRLLYGCDQFDEKLFSAAYYRHDDIVRRYFKDRPSSLLILNLCINDASNWRELCAFLGCECPDIFFPWKNKTKTRMTLS
ncbi:MAG: sulfotransferase [Chthoniobacter sp.]|nr:sulfotransferase [Chthoniobacter sp.]